MGAGRGAPHVCFACTVCAFAVCRAPEPPCGGGAAGGMRWGMDRAAGRGSIGGGEWTGRQGEGSIGGGEWALALAALTRM